MGNRPTSVARGIPDGRQRAFGSSMPRLLNDSRTLAAAHGWYGAGSVMTCCEAGLAGAVGSRPVPPTPKPEFASSQDPRRLLEPCHTPVRSGFPSDIRGTDDAGDAFAESCGDATADDAAIARTAAVKSRRITAP